MPLYRVFCAVTGYGGTPQIGGAAPGAVTAAGQPEPGIVVRFNADTNPKPALGLPPRAGRGSPEARRRRQIAFYEARNRAAEPVTGIALYNVTPDKVGQLFPQDRLLLLQPADAEPRSADAVPGDASGSTPPSPPTRAPRDVHTITLSYTFFRSLADAAATGALAKAGPHVGPLTQ